MRCCWGVCAVFCLSSLFAQDATIRTTVPLVVLPTSVTDQRGHPIPGLTASDFILLDNAGPKPVNVDVIESGLAPIALVVLIQTSDISLSALAKIRKVGAMIPEAVVGENGEAAVVTFDERINIVQDFTRDADRIANAFAGLKPSDTMGGRMIDAVEQALTLLAHRPGSRRPNILIVGESKDRGSRSKLADLQERLQHTGVTIYALPYSAYLTPFTTRPEDYAPSGGNLLTGITELTRLGKQNTVEALTKITGGVVDRFETKSKLEKNLMQLAADVHNRYLISFVPDHDLIPRFHSIALKIKDHPDAMVRTRPGYWTEPSVSNPERSQPPPSY